MNVVMKIFDKGGNSCTKDTSYIVRNWLGDGKPITVALSITKVFDFLQSKRTPVRKVINHK